MRVVIDTNIVISGIFWKGPPHEILEMWLRGEISILVTTSILSEYTDTLKNITGRSGQDTFEKWRRYLTELSEIVEGRELGDVCRDPDDDKFLEAAVGGSADFLISGDKDLLSLEEIHGIPIIKPRKFIDKWQKRTHQVPQ